MIHGKYYSCFHLLLECMMPCSAPEYYKWQKEMLKARRLHLFRNRQDERLSYNRILPPLTRNSWAVHC